MGPTRRAAATIESYVSVLRLRLERERGLILTEPGGYARGAEVAPRASLLGMARTHWGAGEEPRAPTAPAGDAGELSEREREVLALVAAG